MRKRFVGLLAVLTLGLIPAVAAAVDAPPPAPPAAPIVLVKAYATVVAVTPVETGTTVEFDVQEAHDRLDGSTTETLSTGINGQHIVGAVTPDTRVFRNDTAVEFAALQPGMKVMALLKTDCRPVAPSCAFTVRSVNFHAPKPNPGDKFEGGFFPRLWHTRGQILSISRVDDRNILNLDVRQLENAPKRFRDEGSRLVHLDAYVIVPDTVVITNADGRRITFADLTVDGRVQVVGKFLRPAKWMKDESGEPTPTLLAKRIQVKALEGSHSAP